MHAGGHQRAVSRDVFIVTRGHFIAFCPLVVHSIMFYQPEGHQRGHFAAILIQPV